MQVFLRKYNTSASCDFSLYSTDGSTILTSAAISPSACIISQNEGTSAYSTNSPVVRSNGFSINFTASELATKRLYVKIVDTNSTKTWLDTSFVVESYSSSASQHGDIASGLLDNLIDTVSVRQIFTEALATLVGDIVKSGDNYAFLSRDGLSTVVSLSAALGNRVRN